MHFRLLVTLSLPRGTTSKRARQTVCDTLAADDSFCGQGGRFGSPLCDWFVIGGRWSGLLAETILGTDWHEAVHARFPELAGQWVSESAVAKHAGALDELWRKHGGRGPCPPYNRSSYKKLGFADDAMIVTERLYDDLLSEYQGRTDVCGYYADLDDEPLGTDFIGRKWLVVVDYHS